MPRIIAGRYKGCRLVSPRGCQTRPTADQIKEAMFSMLESQGFDFTGARVLDFFAGGGSLGLEALSRGAAGALFCDQSPLALEAVHRNLEKLEQPPSQTARVVWPRGWNRLPAGLAYDLLVLDPPYAESGLPLQLLREAARRGAALPGAWALWEQDAAVLAAWKPEEAAPWRPLKSRSWGRKAAAILRL